MKARAVAALALVFLQPWVAANDRAISAIADPRARAAQRAVFERTQSRLHDAQRAHGPLAADAPAQARAILADRRRFSFGAIQKPPPKTVWERLQDWIGARWEALLKALFGRVHLSANANVAIGDVMFVLALVAFLAIAVRLAWQYARKSAAPLEDAFALDPAQSAAAIAARANRRAEEGDYNAAVALLFSAALHVLADRGIVDADGARTVGELRRAVKRRSSAAAGPFATLAMLLTRAVYAEVTLDAQDWNGATHAYAALRTVHGEVDAA